MESPAPRLSNKFYYRAKWATLKTDTKATVMNYHMEWIADGGQVLFSMIQMAVEAAPIVVPVVQGVAIGPDGIATGTVLLTAQQKMIAATAAKAIPSRAKISTDLLDYAETELRKALAGAKGGSIKV